MHGPLILPTVARLQTRIVLEQAMLFLISNSRRSISVIAQPLLLLRCLLAYRCLLCRALDGE